MSQLADTSRARVQQLIREKNILVNGAPAKASRRLRASEAVSLSGSVPRPPLRAIAEALPLEVVYEDDDLAVIAKPAGMMVHAGAGDSEQERNRGTLVNALLHRFRALSSVGGELRPGIVHRLDKQTSGLIVVAKNDSAHRKLANEFSRRQVRKTYVALVHGWLKQDRGMVAAAISRDLRRRMRMTTRRQGGRQAITHYEVERRLHSEFGKFTLVRVRIETGRTHQIRVHMASLGHPVVGDTLYGAPREIAGNSRPSLSLPRHFLHAAELEFRHPATGNLLGFSSPIPGELGQFLRWLE
ncbi:MAG: RluA family pseudouridine synthase [Acidobacteria bacterium]|nr:RluA family pseudouridine synthase [Acidobacteriota bacterium]MBV9624268.1 RluA family pseudouridine synthase [Acidobacteriota bacterium]